MRVRLIEEIQKDPESVNLFTQSYGKEYVEALQKDDVEKLRAEGEKYYRQFAAAYVTELTPKRLVSLCASMAYETDKASEALFRALLEKDSRPEVQGTANLFLAKLLWLSWAGRCGVIGAVQRMVG